MNTKTRHQVLTVIQHLDEFEIGWFRQLLLSNNSTYNLLLLNVFTTISEAPNITIPKLRERLSMDVQGVTLFYMLTKLEAIIVANMHQVQKGQLAKSTVYALENAFDRMGEVSAWVSGSVPEVCQSYASFTFVPELVANDRFRENVFWN